MSEHGRSEAAGAPHEHDAMLCRCCGKEERASEGYPCLGCGTFICLICTFRGHEYCLACEESRGEEIAV